MIALLEDRNSWLTKHLFTAPDSVKRYFEDLDDIEVMIFPVEDYAVEIVYKSPSRKFGEWKDCCFFLRDGKWEFAGIFDWF